MPVLDKIAAIKLLDSITDRDDPYWENETRDWYVESEDRMPTFQHVLLALGVTLDEYQAAFPHSKPNWPNGLYKT